MIYADVNDSIEYNISTVPYYPKICGFVYYIQLYLENEQGPIKIGHSRNPLGRLDSFQKFMKYPLRMLFFDPVWNEEPLYAEKRMHDKFSALRLTHVEAIKYYPPFEYCGYEGSSEWFRPGVHLLDHIVRLGGNIILNDYK